MVHCRKFLWGCALFAGLTVVAWGDDEVELRVNGDFGGAAPGAVMAPGWTADELPGQTKVVPGEDWDEFGLKVVAPDGNAKTVCSDFFPVAGRTLKLEVSLRGNGMASVGFQAFDQAKKPLVKAGQSRAYQLSEAGSEVKNYFSLTDPNVKFIRICLTANPGTRVVFEEVEAEFKSVYPPASAAMQSVTPVVRAVAAEAAGVASAQPGVVRPLIHDKFYALSRLAEKTELQVSLPRGSEIDFELGEDGANDRYWTVSQYDPAVCQVKLEHDIGGIWPFRYDKAEVELKAMAPGKTTLVFNCAGKSVIIHFSVQ